MYAAIAYVTFAFVMFLLQSRLIYYPNMPSRAVTATPDQAGLIYQSVKFATEDGVQLDGWFLPVDQPRGVLLFFHGNAGNISHRFESLQIFHDLGLSSFIFDYRGYGRSEGKPSEHGTYRDAEAAWRYLTDERQIPKQSIVFFGRSLGASIAAHLAMTQAPRVLILESAFTSVPDVGARTYPFLPVRWLSRFQYNTKQYLKSVSAPVLIVHSRQDEIIRFEHGRTLFASANEPKRLLEIRGGHNDGFLVSGKTYINGIDTFLKDHLDR
ncbi:MAG: alpha/beta hydrolase [Alphaproteobacteria bacterium]|nr:alpha/beta hydrolase [Alphaproteobacteria bacterium]